MEIRRLLTSIKSHPFIQRAFQLTGLSPLSLAGKCRIAFGAAVLFILTLALLIPYLWMGKLTEKASLDAGRDVAKTVYQRHFQLDSAPSTGLAMLEEDGSVTPANDVPVRWFHFAKTTEKQLTQPTEDQKRIIDFLKSQEDRCDYFWLERKKGLLQSNYVRLVRATDSCISCHNPQGSATAFNRNEPVGAIVVRTPAREIRKTIIMNWIWIIVAGLLAGAGAIVAFYIITQRVILRPVRQLRALANNVAEGNIDVRSAIKTHDEFERFSNAFNNMLDSLQDSQAKLRQANIQLDNKIAQLSERNIELFKANKLKSEFLANVSHEFRTPLNAILGFAEILREKPAFLDRGKSRRYAENIMTSGRALLNMINDLLDLAKAEAGKIELHLEKTSIPQLCQAVVSSFSSLSEKKKIKVKLLVSNDIPIVQTDPGKVQQILYNLLSNAIKFTPEKGRVEVKASMPDEKTVRIAVTDTGCGIAEADKEKIFEKFRQADGSLTRRTTGSGLGLAISKELAATLAGSISYQSDPGKGSTFWLDIPVVLTASQNNNKTG